MTASENNPNRVPADSDAEDETLDMEMALLALSTSDVGGPLQEINLDSLSSEEKRALLTYLRHRFNLAPDPQELSENFDADAEEANTGASNQGSA